MGAPITLIGHLTIDHIAGPLKRVYESIGGPPAYGGLAVAKLGHQVLLLTRFGRDIYDQGLERIFNQNLMLGPNYLTSGPSTRFLIRYTKTGRRLRLIARCTDLSREQLERTRCEFSVVSPVCGEMGRGLLAETRSKCDFMFVDPQGFLRAFDSRGWCTLRPPSNLDFVKMGDAIKVDPEEGRAIVNSGDPIRVVKTLLKMGPSHVIYTLRGRAIYIGTTTGVWKVKPPAVRASDTTGAGDILSATFTASLVRGDDPRHALSIAIAAVYEILSPLGGSGLQKAVDWTPVLAGAEEIEAAFRRVD